MKWKSLLSVVLILFTFCGCKNRDDNDKHPHQDEYYKECLNNDLATIIIRFKNRVSATKQSLITIEFVTDTLSANNDTMVFISLNNCYNLSNKTMGVCVYDSTYIGIIDNENIGGGVYNSKCLIRLNSKNIDCDTSEWKFLEIYKLSNHSFKECEALHYEGLYKRSDH